jgi:hypothetical protein
MFFYNESTQRLPFANVGIFSCFQTLAADLSTTSLTIKILREASRTSEEVL